MYLLFNKSFLLTILYTLNPLYHNGSSCPSTVANSCNTILAHLQLVKQRGQDPRSRATQGVAKRDGTSQEIDLCVLEAENLMKGVSKVVT